MSGMISCEIIHQFRENVNNFNKKKILSVIVKSMHLPLDSLTFAAEPDVKGTYLLTAR